ncbi:MAG: abortive infection protein, partial [Bifidobacteriaceae bacterium]|nr:abortive infection protein [Bifidobacteriaceae bacterium]
SPEAYGLGLTKVRTNFGNYVNAYDVERSICDVIRSREREDYEYVKYAVREYLRSRKKNLQKLMEYAEKLGVQSKVERYIELQY